MQGALWIFHDRQRLVEIGGTLVLEINPVEVFYRDEAAVLYGLSPETVSKRQAIRELAVKANVGE